LISVNDNGVGFKKEKLKKEHKFEGFGLISIKERLESFNGRMKIESEPGRGTTTTIEIPTVKK